MENKNENVIELFFEVSRIISRYARSYGQNSCNPLTGQYKCLLMLERTGKITQKRLAELLQIRSTSLSELLSKLEKKQYISRTPVLGDKRAFIVELTKEGILEAEKLHSEVLKQHKEIVIPLDERDQKEFERMLNVIKDYYGKLEDEKNGKKDDK